MSELNFTLSCNTVCGDELPVQQSANIEAGYVLERQTPCKFPPSCTCCEKNPIYDQNSPPFPPAPPKVAAPQTPISPHIPTRQPLYNPSTPCPFRLCISTLFITIPGCPLLLLGMVVARDRLRSPSSYMIDRIVPKRPLYGPGSTTVSRVLPLSEERAMSIWPRLSTVSIGSLIPNSTTWLQNVAMAYRFGVNSGSTPILERRNSGVDAEMNVGSVECSIVVGAIERGSVQLARVLSVAIIDRGG